MVNNRKPLEQVLTEHGLLGDNRQALASLGESERSCEASNEVQTTLGPAAVVRPLSPSLCHHWAQTLSMTVRATVPGNQKILPLPLPGKFHVASASLNHFLFKVLCVDV